MEGEESKAPFSSSGVRLPSRPPHFKISLSPISITQETEPLVTTQSFGALMMQLC